MATTGGLVLSTRIANAYRLKPGVDLWRFLKAVRERGQKEVIQRLRDFYWEYVEEMDPESEAYKEQRLEYPDRGEASLRLAMAYDELRVGFKKAIASSRRDRFDPDVNVAVTRHRTGFYLRAFCDPVSILGGSLDFLTEHPDLEDFHFQNATDRPPKVSAAAWDERRQIWEEMSTGGGFFRDQLVLEISNWQSFDSLNPWLAVAREYREHPPELPSREEVLARGLRKLEAFAQVTAEPGQIQGKTKAGAVVLVERGKKSGKRPWVSRIDGKAKTHVSLNLAVDWVWYQHTSPSLRGMIDEFRTNAIRERKRQRRKV